MEVMFGNANHYTEKNVVMARLELHHPISALLPHIPVKMHNAGQSLSSISLMICPPVTPQCAGLSSIDVPQLLLRLLWNHTFMRKI